MVSAMVGSKIVVSKIIVVSGPLAGWFASFLLCASGAHEITEAQPPTQHCQNRKNIVDT